MLLHAVAAAAVAAAVVAAAAVAAAVAAAAAAAAAAIAAVAAAAFLLRETVQLYFESGSGTYGASRQLILQLDAKQVL